MREQFDKGSTFEISFEQERLARYLLKNVPALTTTTLALTTIV